jgi:aspartyl-tRNA synthetase
LIADVTEEFKHESVTFNAFKKIVSEGGVVRAICAPKTAGLPRSFFDKLNEWAKEEGAPGLGYIKLTKSHDMPNVNISQQSPIRLIEGWIPEGPIAKFIPDNVIQNIAKKAVYEGGQCLAGDVIFFVCDKELLASKFAGKVRVKLGQELNLLEKDVYKFCWVVDFPYYEWDEEEKKIIFSHNPFSMPQGGMEALESAGGDREKLLSIYAYQYDIVCNGIELSSGAIRNHRPDIMYKAFAIAGYDKATVDARFGAMINAFKFGAPPHGGLAPGVDRMVMLLADEPNIREIIAFPMNQKAEDLMMQAPAFVDDKQLRELNIQLSAKARAVKEGKE